MENKDYETIQAIFKELNNVHYQAGPISQQVARLNAVQNVEDDELKVIYHLVESHIPSLRMKTIIRYEKGLAATNSQKCLSKNNVALHCTNNEVDENINYLLFKIREMPSEWTLVQITPKFSPKENLEDTIDKHYTNSLYLTVFNCGVKSKPFYVYVEAPRDNVTGDAIELMQEVHSIMKDNKAVLGISTGHAYFKGPNEKMSYLKKRQNIDNRLKMLITDLQNLYLREWRCLLIGKYVNSELETKIDKCIEEFFKLEAPSYNFNNKTCSLLKYLIKSSHYLKLDELKRAVQNIISVKTLQKETIQFVRKISAELLLHEEKRHPLILILDDSLDCCPWEMIDILKDVSVTRMPSVHLTHALFQEHKHTIRGGFKTVENPENGTFIVNPDRDLNNMQNRILSFYDYWVPKWSGVVGRKPTDEEFEKMLVSSEIFAYNGHGSGTHLLQEYRIEKIHVRSVVLLFGCSSTRLKVTGPRSAMYSPYHMYLIACSPCIVGSLWEVTDLDTDILTTEFLSHWIPNNERTHWKNLEKTKWNHGEERVDFSCDKYQSIVENHEPELLKALSMSKKSSSLRYYITKAGIVARGIPVKILSK